MLGLDHHRNALGIGDLLNSLGDLASQVFLNLQTTGEHVDDARDLGQTDYLAGRDVGNMGLADERQHMVLAQRVQLDVLDDHHLVVVGVEQCAVDDLVQRLVIAVAEKLHGLGGALRCALEAITLRLLSQVGEDVEVVFRQFFQAHVVVSSAYLRCRPPFSGRQLPVI